MSNSILPPNATALERGLDTAVAARLAQIEIPLRDLYNPNTCPANLLPWLAWALAIVDWDAGWSEQQQRDVIRTAYYMHARRGTVATVKESLAALGYISSIKEWFQYPEGEFLPYTFTADVNIDGQPIGTDDLFAAIVKRINRAKNVRSHLARLRVTAPNISTHYTAAAQNHGIYCATGGPLEVLEEYEAPSGGQEFIAVAITSSPFIQVYPWSADGFGAKFSNPLTLPGAAYGVAFTPLGTAVAVAHNSAPYISVYPWSADGFGAKYSNPGTESVANGRCVAFSPSGGVIAIAGEYAPYIAAYSWSADGFGGKYSNPATAYGAVSSIAFSPSGVDIAFANAYWVSACKFDSNGFGTKYSSAVGGMAGHAKGIAFSPSGNAVAAAGVITPYITVYPWSSNGFGTKFIDPTTSAASGGEGVAFSPSGSGIAVVSQSSPYITAYPWNGVGFGTKYSTPPLPSTTWGRGVAFSPSGTAVAVAGGGGGFTAYSWGADGFGGKYSNPATHPWNSRAVAFGKIA